MKVVHFSPLHSSIIDIRAPIKRSTQEREPREPRKRVIQVLRTNNTHREKTNMLRHEPIRNVERRDSNFQFFMTLYSFSYREKA